MSKKILIVEDEDLIASVICMRLQGLGYSVSVASDGKEGLDMAGKVLPDLAILDVGLPLLNGNELCERIKSAPATKDARIIMLTGMRLPAGAETSDPSRADIYMTKPYEWQSLLCNIKKLLGEIA